MRPSSRKPVRKKTSANRFKKMVGKTKAANIKSMPMRGGYRF